MPAATPVAPPLSAIGNVQIEIFGPNPDSAKWDVALWDVDTWASIGWRNVTPQAMVCEVTWGADQPQGALTVCAAGSWQVTTYDPDRLLDPSNGASPFVASLRPGRPFRVVHINPTNFVVTVVRQGLIDEVTFNLVERTGTIKGSDNISLMAQANLPEKQNEDTKMPGTLRARARYLLQKANLDLLVQVESDGSDPLVTYPNRVLNGMVAPLPEAYWGFGEDTGNFIDSMPNGFPAVPSGTITRVAALAGTDGAIKADAGAGVTYGNLFSDMGPTWAVLAWITWDGAGEHYIYDKIKTRAAGGYTGWRVQVGSDGSLRILVSNPTDGVITTLASSPGTIEPNVKFHVAFVRDTVESRIYLNGQRIFTGAPGPSPVGYDSTMIAKSGLNGTLDELGLWRNVILTDENISALYTDGSVLLIDPPVGPAIDTEASVWNHILNAAYDALYACWIDRFGVMRFRSFGNPRDEGFAVGGTDGIPIENIEVNAGLAGVFTRIVAYDIDAPTTPVTAFDATKASIYGEITLRREPPVPDAETWANNLLLDRSGAALQYVPHTIYPQTVEHLMSIIDLGMMDVMHVIVESVDPAIDVPSRILGGKIVIDTGTGWTAAVQGYIPANEWEEQETEPPEPEVPPDPGEPPVATKEVTRYYDCVKDAVGAKEPGGRNYGAGTDGELPVGAWMGWKFRAFFDFEDIDFSDVVGDVVQAAIEVDTTTQVQVGFGSTPKVVIKRVTESWSEGNRDHPSYDNALIYPGPSCTSTNSKTIAVPDAENRAVELLITQMVRDWQHGSKQYGVGMFSAGEDSEKYTTEFWARTNGTTSKRPRLRLTVKVPV